MSETDKVRDGFWRGEPKPVRAFAALDLNGAIMPASVRPRAEDVRLACGECVPVRILITYIEDDGHEPR